MWQFEVSKDWQVTNLTKTEKKKTLLGKVDLSRRKFAKLHQKNHQDS
jgi:hypothetical protein